MTKQRIAIHGYQVDSSLYDLVNNNILPNTGITPEKFWLELSSIFNEFIPANQNLLIIRELLQHKINRWHLEHQNESFDAKEYRQFLLDIGYLLPEVENFSITTDNVDAEVASIAGPQLVVPLMNARYALNAANSRWGSLYDAIYGSDLIPMDGDTRIEDGYNAQRGAKTIAFGRDFLDQNLPLSQGSHHDVTRYYIDGKKLVVEFKSGKASFLKNNECLIGFNGSKSKPTALLFKHHGLHIDIQIDSEHHIGKQDLANIKDIVIESALTAIQDCEDSIAAVDVDDKLMVYKNWLGLMQGTLSESLVKNGKKITRCLHDDRHYQSLDDTPLSLSGRSLLFIRNVGHLMTTDAILTKEGEQVPEGILDGIITSLISLHDIRGNSAFKNSLQKSIYIVKPKMHGPDEVQFSNDLFARIETALNLPKNTIKMGVMDEERRTSINLKNCIAAAKSRIAFINTGFLDRTGDEIHTSMLAGAMVPKDEMKDQAWIEAYERRNVRIGLEAGFHGKAQIGKGMWAVPDHMKQMYIEKISHPKSGANCAWVPSPTAATIHAIHYHQVDVLSRQLDLLKLNKHTKDDLNDLLTLPLLRNKNSLTKETILKELDNNIQGLLGYIVRWIDQGIGCSKVLDIDNIGRMEDRATLRISSQHLCNWLEHKLIDDQQIINALIRMAKVVDLQNFEDKNYIKMSDNIGCNIVLKTALALIFQGKQQPNGYTEPMLHKSRKKVKCLNL